MTQPLHTGSEIEFLDDAVMELVRLAQIDYDAFLRVKELLEAEFSNSKSKFESDIRHLDL